MGICYGKNPSSVQEEQQPNPDPIPNPNSTAVNRNSTPVNPNSNPNSYRASPYRFSPFRSPFRSSNVSSPAFGLGNGTPGPVNRPFPPPSPAKHITAFVLKRLGKLPKSSNDASLPEGGEEPDKPLRKTFGYPKNFEAKYELGQEVGRGHFGYTCLATAKKSGRTVAVKVITKAKMTTAISIDDVKREVKILKALTGHPNLVQFYDSFEDNTNVYIVMEYCEGGELLDRILQRGGKYPEDDAKAVIRQILNVVAYFHLQGVVHRDLKPENFLFTTKDETSELKAIDFGLSDFVRPDERLNDIVGSAYYVAPEVLHRQYSIEADTWSIGVIAYILLCGSRPFWARTESGIFRSVLRSSPSFDEAPWPSVSDEAKDFVKRLLNKDRHKRMTAAQALAHPWIQAQHHIPVEIPLDIMIFRQVKSYARASLLRKATLKALAKTLTEQDLSYLRIQFRLLEPNKHGRVSADNFRSALTKRSTDAMGESLMLDILFGIDSQLKNMDFQEFSGAAFYVRQVEGREGWDEQMRVAYELFEEDGNRVVDIDLLARELGVPNSMPAHVLLHDWVRHNDGKLSFFGFTNLMRGSPGRSRSPAP